ncbi:MAG: hypothetical protein A2131_02395 [Candidatus Sungbacteria bacterium GWC2_49_10]|nr:MAG: hypothetical protein A2131_02395 [Candidatus Sungbacteria bacterium GWC2_49_10]
MFTPERTRELFAKSSAIIEGHFVGTNGKHFSVYVAKDRATRLTSVTSELCQGIAERFAGNDIDAVVAPAKGGLPLSQWTAHHLTRLRPDRPEVLALYSEHEDKVLVEVKKGDRPIIVELAFDHTIKIKEGEMIFLRRPTFVLKRGFEKDVRGKRVLEVEDILTTGGSAARTAQAIVEAGGILVGLGVLANGGGVTAFNVGVDRLEALMDIGQKLFSEEECARIGLCAQGTPVNTEFGHGAAFLARKTHNR